MDNTLYIYLIKWEQLGCFNENKSLKQDCVWQLWSYY